MIEALADGVGQLRLAHDVKPVQKQVVVIEHVALLLGFDVGGEEGAQLIGPRLAPRKSGREGLLQVVLRVDRVRVDRQAGRFLREACGLPGEAELVPYQVDEIGRIGAVQHAEGRRQPRRLGVHAQQTVGDGVEGAGPGNAASRAGRSVRFLADLAACLGNDALRAPGHLLCRPTGKGEQEDSLGIGSVEDEVRDPVCQRLGLAGAGAGDDEQRCARCAVTAHSVLDGSPLCRVQFVQVRTHRLVSIRRSPNRGVKIGESKAKASCGEVP